MRGFGGMGGGMGNMGNIMKQVQKAMAQAEQMQRDLEALQVEGSSGGGMVKVVATGKGQVESITIDPQVVDPEDVEMLQDLVTSAVRDALQKAEDVRGERAGALQNSLGLPPGLM